MANLKQLKKRIASIASIQKITKAMQLVAATKMNKAQELFDENSAVLEVICQSYQQVLRSQQKQNNTDDSEILILITANKGLCGGYNSSIIKTYQARVCELERNNIALTTIMVGKKAREVLKNNRDDLYYSNIAVDYSELCDQLVDQILQMMESKKQAVKICFNNYRNTTTYDHTFKCIWPIVPEEIQDVNAIKYEIAEVDIPSITKLYFKICLLNALLSSNLSELSARMVAMDNATRNARELSDKLTLNLNRSRQAMVTKELIEIISGAEAL